VGDAPVSSEPLAAVDPAVLAEAQTWVREAQRIVVLTGAGISTDSGIPDFRGPNGVWTKNPAAERASTLNHYLHEPEVRRASWQTRLHSPAWSAEPNSGHVALVELERQGRLEALVTQNIDGLHQRAGHDPSLVVEVHGTMRRYQCWRCGDTGPMEVMLERVRAGEEDPACRLCGGIVKSATVSFGQSLVPEVIDAALAAAGRADLLLAVGSSLQVYPAANVVPRAKSAGARVVIVNGQPTHMDRYADALLIGPIGELLPALVAPVDAGPASPCPESRPHR